jgi:fructosamine-3-kinase
VNGGTEDWPYFWAERRLRMHLPHLPCALARRVEALGADLPNRLPARPIPALLHGDLWGGNILVAGDLVSGLIDRLATKAEVGLAMLGLFDQPDAAFYEAYGSLEPGHDERTAIYRLFGAGYRPMIERLLQATGA